MKAYNCRCPNCGRINMDLFLDETEGMMECEECGSLINNREYDFDLESDCARIPA